MYKRQGGENSLFQFGYSKDDPTLKQVKVMVAALDPLGLPLVSQVVAGNIADDPLYIPAVDRVLKIIDGVGLLFVGDSKMSELSTRAHIHWLEQHYLCPLAQKGDTAKEMVGWIESANNGNLLLTYYTRVKYSWHDIENPTMSPILNDVFISS